MYRDTVATETADDLCTPTDCDVTFVKYSDRVEGGGEGDEWQQSCTSATLSVRYPT